MSANVTGQAKPEILVYGPAKPTIIDPLRERFTLRMVETSHDIDRLSRSVAEQIHGMAVTGLVPVESDLLSHCPKLEIIASFGVGYDHVDLGYAREHGIIVTNTPVVLTEETADAAIGLLICTAREFIKADRFVRSGEWLKKPYPLTRGTLRDRTVGIVGMGRIGRAIARRLEAMRVPVVYHSRRPVEDVPYRYFGSLIDMARAVDVLIVMTPGGLHTMKLIDAEIFSALGPNGILINLSRGSVIDEAALVAALRNKTIMAAGLDVFANEPHVPEELRAMDNVVLLPHIGSASVHTRAAMDHLVVENLRAWFAGKPPLTPVPETPFKGR
ncbi:MAG: 2-hydroxyacid dehydrogenase [Xanthobacteraceae bacterium]|nr:MAG: 2-hydroxyacid dehydrogenase [Xanthobacteraceae bacterium]